MEGNFLNVDPDTPIYRIFPLWFFQEVLRTGQTVLVRPSDWEDPYETLHGFVMVSNIAAPRHQVKLPTPASYAQCWSHTGHSYSLLRAYSRVVRDPHSQRNICPQLEGVRVRSTPRKLLTALYRWCAERSINSASSCFIGSVEYREEEEIKNTISRTIMRDGLKAYMGGRQMAELLLQKRKPFGHEAEVRLLYVEQRESQQISPRFHIDIDPCAVFDEVTFDPLLSESEYRERQKMAIELNYQGEIVQWSLFRKIGLNIMIDHL